MKVKTKIAAAACAAAILLGASSAAAALSHTFSAKTNIDSDNRKKAGYTLAQYKNGVGVFEDGQLLFSADIDLNSLRSGDRELLKNGIETRNYEEILKLLEDFNS